MKNFGQKISKNSKFLWLLFIAIILSPNFVLAAPAQDNSRGTFYDDFTNIGGVALSANTEVDVAHNWIGLKPDEQGDYPLSSTFDFTEDFSTNNFKDTTDSIDIDWNINNRKLKLFKENDWTNPVSIPETYLGGLGVDTNTNKLYAGTAANREIYELQDASFQKMTGPWNDGWFYSFSSYQNKLYASGNNGDWSTSDGIYVYDGSSWSISSGSPTEGSGNSAMAMAVYDNKLYLGTRNDFNYAKVFSFDGASWQDTNVTSTQIAFISLVVYNNKLYAGSSNDSGWTNPEVFVYDGNAWNLSTQCPDASSGAAHLVVHDNKLYASCENPSYGSRMFVYDGDTWSAMANIDYRVYQLISYDNKLYAATSNGLYVFDNNSWDLEYPGSVGALAVYNNRLYLGLGNTANIVSIGTNFSYSSSGVAVSLKINGNASGVQSAKISPTQILNGQTINYQMSADGGSHWENVTPGLEHIFIHPGDDLRWKTVLTTSNISASPEITNLEIQYQATASSVTSISITPSEVGSWDKIIFNHTLNDQAITYQILDSSDALIPDSVLPGNAAGFSASGTSMTIDLYALPSATYPSIKIKANLLASCNLYTPTINSWKTYWIKAKAGDDIASGGSASFDATSSVGDSYTCAWDFDVSDGVDWNNPDSNSCQPIYDYRSNKGGGIYTASLRIKQGTATAYDYDTKVVTVNLGSSSDEESPKYLNFSANRRILLADSPNQSIISAQVLNKNKKAVLDGTTIVWSLLCPNLTTDFKDLACGTLSNNQSLTANGAVSTIFTPGQLAGSIIVRGCAINGVCAEQAIKVALKQRGKIILKSNYSILPADGKSRIKIYVKVYDRYLNPWSNVVISLKLISLGADQKEIKFTGELSSTEIKTDNNGEALVYYSPGEQIGKIKIKANIESNQSLSGFRVLNKLAYFLKYLTPSFLKSTASHFFNFVMAATAPKIYAPYPIQPVPIIEPLPLPEEEIPEEEIVLPPNDEEVVGELDLDLVDSELMTTIVEDEPQPLVQPPDPSAPTPLSEQSGSQIGVPSESYSSAPPPLPVYLRAPVSIPSAEAAPTIIEIHYPETKAAETASDPSGFTEIIEKTTDLTQNTISAATVIVKKIHTNPTVQTVNQVVAPTVSAVTVAAVAASGAASSATAVPLFNMAVLLFTQPSYLLTRRRKSWGTVYDSLSKEPVSLAIIRLYEIISQANEQNKTKKLIQTRVTSADGRYFFLVKPYTNYQIEVVCNGYKFPSHILKAGVQETIYTDVYYGEVFNSNDNTIINPNLPLDSQEGKVSLVGFNKKIKTIFADLEQFLKAPINAKEKEYRRIKKEALTKKALRFLAYLAPILGFINLLISPNKWTSLLFILQLLMLLVFRYFIEKILPYKQHLGRVFDIDTNKNIGQSLIYLFEPQFGKLIQTQIADNDGLYGFLIGNQKYYLVAEKPGYVFPQDKMEIVGQVEGIAKKDLGMKKI